MKIHGYAVQVYQEDDGSWAAEVPDLPGCVAAGENPNELFEMLHDAMDAWMESARADGEPIPAPSREPDYSGRFLVRSGRQLHRQLAWRARADGVSLNQYVVTALSAAVAQPDPIEFEPFLQQPWETVVSSAHMLGGTLGTVFDWPDEVAEVTVNTFDLRDPLLDLRDPHLLVSH